MRAFRIGEPWQIEETHPYGMSASSDVNKQPGNKPTAIASSIGPAGNPLTNASSGFVAPGSDDPVTAAVRQNQILGRLFSLQERAPYWKDNLSFKIDDPEHLMGGPMPTNDRYNLAIQTAFDEGIRISNYQQLIRDTGNPLDWFDIHDDDDIAWCWEFSATIGKQTPLKYLLMHGIRRFVVTPGGHKAEVASLFPGGRMPDGARAPKPEEPLDDYLGYLSHHVNHGLHKARATQSMLSVAGMDEPASLFEHVEGPMIQSYGVWHLVPVRGEEYRALSPLTFDRLLCHDRAYEPPVVVDLPLDDLDMEPSDYNDPPRFEPRLYLMLMVGFRRILETASDDALDAQEILPSTLRKNITTWLRTMKLIGGVADHLYTRDADHPRTTFEEYLQNAAFPSFLSFIKIAAGVNRQALKQLQDQGVVSRLDLSLAFLKNSNLDHLFGIGPVTSERLKGLVIPPEMLHQMSSRQKAIEADPFIQAVF